MAAAQKAAERERKAQQKAAAGRRAGPAEDDRHGHPDRRQGRHVAARPGPDPRRLRDPVRWRQGPLTRHPGRIARRSRPGSGRGSTRPGGQRSRRGPRASWRGSAAGSRARSSSRTCGRGRRRCASRPRPRPSGSRRPDPGPRTRGRSWRSSARHGVERAVLPLAVHPTRPWLLFDDAGPTLRASRPDGRGDHDLAAWERILTEYAALQRSRRGRCGRRPRCWPPGTPDERPERLAEGWIGSWPTTGSGAGSSRPSGPLRRQPGRVLASRGAAVGDRPGRSRRARRRPRHHPAQRLPRREHRRRTGRRAVLRLGRRGHRSPVRDPRRHVRSIARHTGRDPGDPVVRAAARRLHRGVDGRRPAGRADRAGRPSTRRRPSRRIGKALAWERALIDLEPGRDGRSRRAGRPRR